MVVHATSALVTTIAVITLSLGAAIALSLYLIAMPSPLMWGGIVALLNFIPSFGPILAAVMLGMGGLMVFDDVWLAFLPDLIQDSFHLVSANAITPLVLGRGVREHTIPVRIEWGRER